jgi:hypothetical protein
MLGVGDGSCNTMRVNIKYFSINNLKIQEIYNEVRTKIAAVI